MQFELGKKRSWFVAIIAFAVFLGGIIYIYRLRNALITSSDGYKSEIVALKDRVFELEGKETDLYEEISTLKEEILTQGAYITNGVSSNYEMKVDPSKVNLENRLLSIKGHTEPLRIILAGHLYGNPYASSQIAPAQTLINAIDEINKRQPDLFFFFRRYC